MIGYMQNMPDDLTVSDLKELDKIIEKNMKEIDEKIVALNLSYWCSLKLYVLILINVISIKISNKNKFVKIKVIIYQ